MTFSVRPITFGIRPLMFDITSMMFDIRSMMFDIRSMTFVTFFQVELGLSYLGLVSGRAIKGCGSIGGGKEHILIGKG